MVPAGEDWLQLSWGISWPDRVWPVLRASLIEAQRAARGRASGYGGVDLGGRSFLAAPRGDRVGGPAGGTYVDWVLLGDDGAILKLADRQHAHATVPSGQLIVPGMSCLLHGARQCWRSAGNLLDDLHAEVVWDRLGRVDLCLDLPGVSMQAFEQAYEDHHFVTRAKRHSRIQGTGATIQFGLGDIKLLIYNKLAEVMGGRSQRKLDAMIVRRWGGILPAAATRVEYQLRAPVLRQW